MSDGWKNVSFEKQVGSLHHRVIQMSSGIWHWAVHDCAKHDREGALPVGRGAEQTDTQAKKMADAVADKYLKTGRTTP